MERKERKVGGLLEKLGAPEKEIVIPEKPGPKILGRDPVVGIIRRTLDLPVLRDELPTLIEISK